MISKENIEKVILIIVAFILCVTAFFLAAMIIFLSVKAMGGKAIAGDLIAAGGGVFGGLLTLLGVRMTLRSQKNETYIESFSSKHLILDDVTRLLNSITTYYSILGDDVLLGERSDTIREWVEEANTSAAKVDIKLYEMVKEFNQIVWDYRMTLIFESHKYKIDPKSESALPEVLLSDETRDYRRALNLDTKEKLSKVLDRVNQYLNEMFVKYKRLTKV